MVRDVSRKFDPHVFTHAGSIFLMALITSLCCLPVSSAISSDVMVCCKLTISVSQRAWHRVMEGLSVTACLAPCDGAKFTFCILVFNQRKIAPVNFLPRRLHVSDGFHYVTACLAPCDVFPPVTSARRSFLWISLEERKIILIFASESVSRQNNCHSVPGTV